MKRTFKIIASVIVILIIFIFGGSVGFQISKEIGYQAIGAPKTKLPPVGSVIRIEGVFEDKTFIGTYAGERRYYQNPKTRNKVSIILEANKAYEVVEQRGEMGAKNIMIVPINN